jgi:hypothetical protein
VAVGVEVMPGSRGGIGVAAGSAQACKIKRAARRLDENKYCSFIRLP